MPGCLLVDDDAEIRESLAQYLQGFGWQVQAVADGAQMRRVLAVPAGGAARAGIDLVVLDLMLPGEDGLSLLRWVQQERGLPVIMLTARGDPTSRVVGLELGADDYLAKPFEPRELVARMQAVLRRSRKAAGGMADEPRELRIVRRGGASGDADGGGAGASAVPAWRFDRLARQLVSPAEVAVALSSAEFRLLQAFVERPGRVLSREQLLDLTRAAGAEVNDRSIDLAVSRLRAKLGDTGREPQLIRTVRGEGYLLDAEVLR